MSVNLNFRHAGYFKNFRENFIVSIVRLPILGYSAGFFGYTEPAKFVFFSRGVFDITLVCCR